MITTRFSSSVKMIGSSLSFCFFLVFSLFVVSSEDAGVVAFTFFAAAFFLGGMVDNVTVFDVLRLRNGERKVVDGDEGQGSSFRDVRMI